MSSVQESLSGMRAKVRFVDVLSTWLIPVCALLLLIEVARGMALAKGWQLVHDAPLMHYVVFLMDHGRAPYRDILEMNMPGAYVTEWLAMHLLGGGAFGWWLWDSLLGVGVIAASAWIAGRGRRSVGIAAGSIAYLSHLSEGPWNMGQRDLVVAVMVLAAFGCMFEAIRRERPVWMAGFMGLCGLAASIKPPAIGIGICFLVATCWLIWRRRGAVEGAWRSFGPYVLWSFAGALVPVLMVVIFLVRWDVVKDFFQSLHGLVAWYAGLERLSLIRLYPKTEVLVQLVLGSIVLFLLTKAWEDWESDFLGAGILAGAALYLIQAKGFSYHLYTEIAFAALWGFLQVQRGLEGKSLARVVAVVTLAVTMLLIPHRLLRLEKSHDNYPMDTMAHLQNDLGALGGSSLSGNIQCLDMTMANCINVLYRMKLVQSTGFIYDFYLFPKTTNTVTAPLQARFLREMNEKKPRVIVLSSHTWPGDVYSYDQVANFPAFAEILGQQYHLDRELPAHGISAGYRIYVLNGTSST